VGTNTKQKTKMHAKGTDVGSGLTADPEHTQLPLVIELVELALVNGSDTELALDGGNQRWSLEKSSGKRLQGARKLCLAYWQLVVQADHAHVLLSGTLLGLDKTGGAIDADDQATGNLGIKSTTVTGLLNS